jgi:hypothetical protein
MTTVRHIVDGNLLSGVVSLPESFLNTKLAITITPVAEDEGKSFITREELRSVLKGSITESISGVLPRTDKTIEDFRAERLSKYECPD